MRSLGRLAALAYGLACYALFSGAFVYLAGFLAGVAVPKTIDSGAPDDAATAVAVDLLLVALFGLQHSAMARPRFKARWTGFVPEPIERSTYVLATAAALALLFAAWRPLPAVIWHAETPLLRGALYALSGLGAAIVLSSSFLIDHFDLFGLRQVALHFRGLPYSARPFATPGFYRFVRHPLYIGFLVFFWAAPTMSVGHLLFSAGMSAYILVAIPLEERDLAAALGAPYLRWRAETPGLVPGRRRAPPAPGRAAP